MRNRVATWLNLVFASIIVIGVFVQVYLIAAYAMGAGEGALDAHGFVGGLVIHGAELLVFLTALVAFWGMWRWIAVNFGLFVFGTIQIFLLPPDEDPGSPWLHALHGLFALFVLLYAAYIAKRDMQLLGLRSRATEAPGPPPPV
jgi:hypothetical protein